MVLTTRFAKRLLNKHGAESAFELIKVREADISAQSELSILTAPQLSVLEDMLNEVINEAYMMNLPPTYKGRRLKIYFVNQSGLKPPKFTFHVNSKGLVHFSYERYLENKLRENFELEGTPIILQFKNKNE